jgi:hypothetical protein
VTKDEYLYCVGRELRDLPWKTRRDLLADLRVHLDEVPPEQLDPPEKYAADLRESAGLPRRPGLVAWVLARRPRNLVLAGVCVTVIRPAVREVRPVLGARRGLGASGAGSRHPGAAQALPALRPAPG